MKKVYAIIILLLFFVLLWSTKKRHDTCCGSSLVEEEEVVKQINPTKITKQTPALVYVWGRSEAITNNLWEAKRNEILSGNEDGKILQISAPYFKAEGEEIGILRAKEVFKKLEKNDLDNVKFVAKLIPFYEEARAGSFEGTDFHWLINNENIQEMNDKTIIYFTVNSFEKINNKNIISYLKQVSESLGSKKIILSGHSDSQGLESKNKILALKRATTIKNELIKLGVDKDRITTISYGEEKPIADNNTSLGREKNRRVELEIK